MKKMLKEFKEFALKGNTIELAVAVVIGATFGTIVKSLVDDIIMPFVGILIGGKGVQDLSINVGTAVIRYGNLLQNILNFIIVAFVLFLVVKTMNTLKDRLKKSEEIKEVKTDSKEELLKEIRDLLKNKDSL